MKGIFAVDLLVTQIIQRHSSPLIDAIAIIITDFGSGVVLVGLTLIAGIIFWHRGMLSTSKIVLFSLTSYPIDLLLKLVFERSRPSESLIRVLGPDNGYSFPSGHAMVSLVVYGILTYLLLPKIPQQWRNAALLGVVVLIIMIGVTRIYLGVHWFTDVVGGWLVGMVILYGLIAAYKKLNT